MATAVHACWVCFHPGSMPSNGTTLPPLPQFLLYSPRTYLTAPNIPTPYASSTANVLIPVIPINHNRQPAVACMTKFMLSLTACYMPI